MPGCILMVAGSRFAPAAFLATSAFRPYKVWRCGEPVAPVGPRSQVQHVAGGFCCDVSEADGDLARQVRDAIDFLIHNRSEFLKLARDETVEVCQLDFGIESRLNRDGIAVHGEYLPVDFVRLVGEFSVAVALSIYPQTE